MRFNLLLVCNDSQLSEVVLKTLSRIFRENFVFEVSTLAEGEKLLSKLNIDLMLVDLDSEPSDLVRISGKFPALQLMGISSYTSLNSRIDPMRHKMLHKQDLATELLDELKSFKKDRSEKPQANQVKNQAATQAEFKDFSSLTASVN